MLCEEENLFIPFLPRVLKNIVRTYLHFTQKEYLDKVLSAVTSPWRVHDREFEFQVTLHECQEPGNFLMLYEPFVKRALPQLGRLIQTQDKVVLSSFALDVSDHQKIEPLRDQRLLETWVDAKIMVSNICFHSKVKFCERTPILNKSYFILHIKVGKFWFVNREELDLT